MEDSRSVAHLESLASMYVVTEAANMLGLKTSRIHAMIEEGSLPSRFATLEETAQLFATGRIRGVPGTGIRLVPDYAIEVAMNRRKRGWPKGKRRRER